MKTHKPATFFSALCSALFLLAVSSGLAAQTYVFNAASFASGHNPQAVANVDLNGDGRLDFIVANYNDGNISVLLGNPDGTFQPHVDYPTGNNPIALLTADFNGDTKIDLAVVNNNCPTAPCTAAGNVVVLLGNGDGTFQPHVDTTVGNAPTALATADFNNDHKLDIAVTNSQDNTVSVGIGNGDGTFSVHKTLTTGANPHGIVIQDFTHDNNLDLMIANTGDSNVSLFRGQGTGNFLAPLLFPTGANPIGLVTADFNTDGSPDIATANSGAPTVSILINKQPAGLGFNNHQDFTVAGFPTQLLAVDLNNDTKIDLAAIVPSNDSISTLISNGNATFLSHQDFATGADPTGLTAGDFTGDGATDLAIVNNLDNTVTVLPGTNTGTLQVRQDIAVGNQPSCVVSGDFNNDGIKDLAVIDRSDSAVLVYSGNGSGGFTPVSGSFPTGMNPSWAAMGDFNSDGKNDLITANAGTNTVSFLAGNGDGTFLPPVPITVGKKPVAIVAADFNADGKLDIAVVNQNDPSVSVLTGNGDGTFTLVKAYFTGAGSVPTFVATGDFIGNGKLDLAVSGGASGKVAVFLGFGDGTFTSAVQFTVGGSASGVAIADFNGDGKLDLVTANNNTNNVSILLGVGNGTFGAHTDFPTSISPFLVAARDLNADGKADVIVSESSPTYDRAAILLGNGDGTLQTHVDHASKFSARGSGEGLTVDDLNNDGAPDFVIADQLANSISIYLNTGMPAFTPAGGLSFGTVNLGSSASLNNTLTNSGSAPVNNLTVSASGQFSQNTACGSSVPVAGNCVTTATFSPTTAGSKTGLLAFADNAVGAPQNLVLTGTGNGPSADLSVTSLTYGVTLIGSTSLKQTITLTNNGNQTLNISTIVTSPNPPFILGTTTCGATLTAGSFCTITVAFRPQVAGVANGTLTITDNAANSPQIVTLTGTGTAVKLTPSNIGFGNQAVGTTSAPQPITLMNTGKVALNISSIVLGSPNPGDFNISNQTCGLTVAKGGSCSMTVTFTPLTTGNLSSAVVFTDDGGASPQSVPLTGTGQ